MAKTETGKRDAPISYRPPAHLRAEFRERVAKSGLSANAYITAAVFGDRAPRAQRHPPAEKQELARLLSRAVEIRDALEENLQAGGRDSLALEEMTDELRVIRAALLTLMERAP